MVAIVLFVLGIIATIWVSRYYFRRSVNKSLSVYRLLNSYVFAGIAPDVRKNLHFIFQQKEVNELQQVVFLVANDGERAISNIIEPLVLQLPKDVEVLDASIVHRSPDALKAQIAHKAENSQQTVEFIFPLLNKGEFFVVKLLLSGNVEMQSLRLRILADDLPRSLAIKHLPPTSIKESARKIEWSGIFVGTALFLFPVWIAYLLHEVWIRQPTLFPYPWDQYVFSWRSLVLLMPSALLIVLFCTLGIAIAISACFDGVFPPQRGPKFPLPKELHNFVFPYQFAVPESFDREVRFGEKSGSGE